MGKNIRKFKLGDLNVTIEDTNDFTAEPKKPENNKTELTLIIADIFKEIMD